MADRSLVVNTFAGPGTLPLLVAEQRGYFAREGLVVEIVRTANSADQLRGLVDGRWQVVHSSPDNLLAWGERTGVSLVAWLGSRNGQLTLVTRPEIGTIGELRGRTLAVDALDTGYAYVLRAILRAHGLGPDEYAFEALGATNLRWEALKTGRALGTLLSPPFTFLAREAGLRLLAHHEEVLPGLLTFSVGSRRDWLDANLDTAAAYARAYISAVAWLYDPANRPPTRDLLTSGFFLTPALADELLDTVLDPRIGISPAGHLDVNGLDQMVRLRADVTGWRPAELSAYYDFRPYLRALRADS